MELLYEDRHLCLAIKPVGVLSEDHPTRRCMPQLLREQKLLPLAGTKYLLVEFFFDEGPEFMEDCFRRITALGFIPVIAHPERYEAVQREPALIPGGSARATSSS